MVVTNLPHPWQTPALPGKYIWLVVKRSAHPLTLALYLVQTSIRLVVKSHVHPIAYLPQQNSDYIMSLSNKIAEYSWQHHLAREGQTTKGVIKKCLFVCLHDYQDTVRLVDIHLGLFSCWGVKSEMQSYTVLFTESKFLWPRHSEVPCQDML